MFTMMVGELDEVRGGPTDVRPHKISTRFLSFIGPLIPFESLCVTFESYEHLGGRTTRHTWSGEHIKLNPWSILLGYLRVWLGIAIFALPFVLYWGKSVTGRMFLPSAYAAVALLVVTFVPGVLTRARARRLGVLRRITGLGCDPAFRFQWKRDETTEELMKRLAELRLPTSPQALMERLPALDRGTLELVFAAAWYQSTGNREWKALREAAWAALTMTALQPVYMTPSG